MLVRLLVSAFFLVIAACSSESEAPVRIVVERYPEAPTKPVKSAPALASLSPESGTAGDLITVRGSHFGGAQGASLVMVGGVPAQVDAWADTQIQFYVPAGLVAGVLDVMAVVEGSASNMLTLTLAAPPEPPGGGSEFPTYARLLGRVDVYGRYTQAGVVVSVSGTALTTATDANGLYFVDQIPPGTRDVTFTVPGGKHEPVTLSGMQFVAGAIERPSVVPLYYGFSLARGLANWLEYAYSYPSGAFIMKDDAGWLWGTRVPDVDAVRFEHPFGDFNYEWTPKLAYLLYSGCSPWYTCNQFKLADRNWLTYTVDTGGAFLYPLNETVLLMTYSGLFADSLIDLTTREFIPLANGVSGAAVNQDGSIAVVQSQLGELYSLRITDQAVTPLDAGTAWLRLSKHDQVLYAKSSPGEVFVVPAAGGVTHATGVTAAVFVDFSPAGEYAMVEDGGGNHVVFSVEGASAPVVITGATYPPAFINNTEWIGFFNGYGTFIISAATGAQRFLGSGAAFPEYWGAAGYFYVSEGNKLYRMPTLASPPELLIEQIVQAMPFTDTRILYWNWAGELRSMPMTGGASALLISGVGYPGPFETKDGETLFFSDGLTTQTLYRVSLTGGTPQPLATGVVGFTVNSAATRVAYRTPTEQIFTVPTTGGIPQWVADSVTDYQFVGNDELRYALSWTMGTNPLMIKRLSDGAFARLAPPDAVSAEYYLGEIGVKSGTYYDHVETRLYRRP